MNFETYHKTLLKELNQTAPSPITTNPDKTDFSEHESGVRLEKRKNFFVHVFGEFMKDLDQHYSTLMSEWGPQEVAFSKAKFNNKISQDAINSVDSIRTQIQRIKNVFRLENKA